MGDSGGNCRAGIAADSRHVTASKFKPRKFYNAGAGISNCLAENIKRVHDAVVKGCADVELEATAR